MAINLENFDLSLLDTLKSEEEKQLLLQALQQYAANGHSDLHDSMRDIDYDEHPVTIHTFMHDPHYLGRALYDAEGKFTVFPYWEKCLEDIFPDEYTTRYNNVVFTGAIGLGKSTIAVIILLYMLYRLLCLNDPYVYFGLQPIDKISISFMNITLENAKGVALDKFNQMLLQSEWFMAHGEMHGTTHLNYIPEKHIEVICGSTNNHIIGRCIFANFSDECNFSTVSDPIKAKERMKKMMTQIDARQRSRFMRGTYLPTINIIASSKDSEQSFLEEYIINTKKNGFDTTLIVDEPQWIVDSRKDSPVKFYVAIGDKMLANELLPLDVTEEQLTEYRQKGYKLVQVPAGYHQSFTQNLDEAICSIIGIATASTLKFLSGAKLQEVFTNEYKNPFIRDIIEVGNAKDDDLQYSNFFDLSRVSLEDKSRPMFIHLDMSTTGDKTGIAGVWITGKETTTKPIEADESNTAAGQEIINTANLIEAQSLRYKLAFCVSIKAPKGAQVSFEKNRLFVNWLREQGFDIKKVSSDTFQSAATLQHLQADGFETEIVSVDRLTKVGEKGTKRVCLPYHNLKTAIYERRVQIFEKCDLLTEELLNLEKESDGHINHPENGKYGSKDSADALCLHGDTEVFLLNGHHKSISELYNEYTTNSNFNEWVLAYDTDCSKLRPVKIAKVINNGNKDNLIKLTLDNGKYLICTEDHKILARDGNYLEAKDTLGISLMPFTYEDKPMYGNRSYTYVYNPNKDGSVTGNYLHKLVAEDLKINDKHLKEQTKLDKEWVAIHHVDANRHNNSPENLEYLTNTEHSLVHCAMNTTNKKRKQVSDAMKQSASQGLHNFQNFSAEQRKYLYNHRVISIEKVPSAEVFDLQLGSIHNFALTNGLIVHNCGATWLAGKYAEQYALEYGEDIQSALNISMESSNESGKKQQLINDFENALAQLQLERCGWTSQNQTGLNKSAKIEDINQQMDILDGLICI